MAAPFESFDPWREEAIPPFQTASDEPNFFAKDLLHDDDAPLHHQTAEPWDLLLDGSPREQEQGQEQREAPLQQEETPRTVQTSVMSLDLSSSGATVAAAEAKLAEAEAKLATLEQQLRASEAKGRTMAAAAGAELAQARAKALALEEELKTAHELIEDNGGLYDEAFVNRVLTEHAQLKAQVNDSTDALIEAAQAVDTEEEEADPRSGCLKGVLKLKGVGFMEFGEVARALRKDHVSKETVEALFDAMGGLITDASFEVFKRRMGEIVGEDREAVKEKLEAVQLVGKKRPRPEAFDALASLFLSKRREMEETNPSGVYASYKLWSPAAGREQTLAEAVRAVVAAHGQLRAQLAAAKAENSALRRQVAGAQRGRSVSPVPGSVAVAAARGRSMSPVPGASSTTLRARSRSPVPASGRR